MNPAHPTTHFWTKTGMNSHRSACGMTAQRAPAGSRDAEHCSSCARIAEAAPRVCTDCGEPAGAVGSMTIGDAWYCPRHASTAMAAQNEKLAPTPAEYTDAQTRATAIGLTLSHDQNGYSLLNAGLSGVMNIGSWMSLCIHLHNQEQARAESAAERPSPDLADVQALFTTLGWTLRFADGAYVLHKPDGDHYATTPDLAPHRRTLEAFQRLATLGEARADATPAARRCACGKVAIDHRNIGGEASDRCQDCAQIAERDDLLEQLGAAYRGESGELGGRMLYRIGPDNRTYTYDEALTLLHATRAPNVALSLAADGGNPRYQIAELLHRLRSLMATIATGDVEELSKAIADLNECQEGTEAAHWLNVGWALIGMAPDAVAP
jgi:hypothetical protein